MIVKSTRKNVEGSVFRIVWKDMKQGDIGEAVEIPSVSNMTIQVLGDFSSTNVLFEGSLESIPTKYFELFSEDGNTYNTMVVWFRPKIIGGDEKSRFTVILLTRRTG